MRLDGDDFRREHSAYTRQLARPKPRTRSGFPDYYLVTESGEIFHTNAGKNHGKESSSGCPCKRCLHHDSGSEALRAIGGYREDLGAQHGFDLWSKILDHRKFANINLAFFFTADTEGNMTEEPR